MWNPAACHPSMPPSSRRLGLRRPIPGQRSKRGCRQAALVIHDDVVVGRQPGAAEDGRHLLVVNKHERLLRVAAGTQATRQGVERDGAFDVPLAVGIATASVNDHHVLLPEVLVQPPGIHNHAGSDLARVDGELLGLRDRLRQLYCRERPPYCSPASRSLEDRSWRGTAPGCRGSGCSWPLARCAAGCCAGRPASRLGRCRSW